MSAFIVSEAHIQALVTFAAYGRDAPLAYMRGDRYPEMNLRVGVKGEGREDALGRVLWRENVRSVKARYSGCADDRLPGPQPTPDPESFSWRPTTRTISPVQALKACACLAYQSCETDDWEETEAFRALKVIEEVAIADLPGYDEAQWEIEERDEPSDLEDARSRVDGDPIQPASGLGRS